MRFVLDECVDARLLKVFIAHSHECWTVVDAGLSSESDDEVSVYAADKGAVFVTDDRELIARRKAQLFGKTLELRGSKPAALVNVPRHLEVAVRLLEVVDDIIVTLSADGAMISAPSWLSAPPG